jgi:hypothetical protein
MLNTLKALFVLFIFAIGSLTACKEEQRYSPDGHISLRLSEPNVAIPEMLEVIQKADPSKICLFTMGDTSKGDEFIFSIARMGPADSMTTREAFDDYVKPVLPPMTVLVSADIYEKDGKMYYRKITESDQPEHKVRSTMFYVMENGRSNILYELKATSGIGAADLVLERMEAMAGSVEF